MIRGLLFWAPPCNTHGEDKENLQIAKTIVHKDSRKTTELDGNVPADEVIVARAGASRMFHDGFLHDWPNRVHLARRVAAGSPLGESRAVDWAWTPPLWSEGTFQSAIARRAASIPRFGLPAGHVGRRDHTPWQQSARESVFAKPFVHPFLA
jgi:hypothetical protein